MIVARKFNDHLHKLILKSYFDSLSNRRFWTRNRPGDTIVDKTDEVSMPKNDRVTGIIFKNHEMPGLLF